MTWTTRKSHRSLSEAEGRQGHEKPNYYYSWADLKQTAMN